MNELELIATSFVLGIATPIFVGTMGYIFFAMIRDYVHEQISQSEKEMRQYVRDYNE